MLKVFSVYDSKAEAYLQPFFCVNRAVGIRNFSAAAGDPSSGFCRHAADYTLFEIGDFNPVSGVIDCYDSFVSLGTALQWSQDGGQE